MNTSKHRQLAPGQYLVVGFVLIIVIGSVLLSLPLSLRQEASLPYLDALFTSVSAVCVTGLVTIDVAETFTIFGRVVIALLILLGGMGFAAVILSIVMFLGWDVGLAQRSLVSEAYNLGTLSGTLKVVRTVVIASAAFQIVGTAVCFLFFSRDYPFWDALGHAAFHSISAFNNAGFDLMGNFSSMMRYRFNGVFNAVTMILIISGGLGFFVVGDVVRKRFSWRKLSMHSRIVLSMTAILIVGGTAAVMVLERLDVLSALFQSVTSRTAGFNTIDTGSLSGATLFFVMLLMFIGASPGSTGGGIKTSTACAIFLSIASLATKRQPALFKRRIPMESILKAFQVLLLALVAIVVGILVISAVEGDAFSFLQISFEVVSAFATVGLSTGITPELGMTSKVMLMLVMFIGRLGPITVATSIRTKESVLKFVEERVFIG